MNSLHKKMAYLPKREASMNRVIVIDWEKPKYNEVDFRSHVFDNHMIRSIPKSLQKILSKNSLYFIPVVSIASLQR